MPNPPPTTFNITTNADQGTVYNGTFNGNNFHSGAGKPVRLTTLALLNTRLAAVTRGPINEPQQCNEQRGTGDILLSLSLNPSLKFAFSAGEHPSRADRDGTPSTEGQLMLY
jgi:hypothetical protein